MWESWSWPPGLIWWPHCCAPDTAPFSHCSPLGRAGLCPGCSPRLQVAPRQPLPWPGIEGSAAPVPTDPLGAEREVSVVGIGSVSLHQWLFLPLNDSGARPRGAGCDPPQHSSEQITQWAGTSGLGALGGPRTSPQPTCPPGARGAEHCSTHSPSDCSCCTGRCGGGGGPTK